MSFSNWQSLALKKARSDSTFIDQAKVFVNGAGKQQDISVALKCLYGGHLDEGLNQLQHPQLCGKVSTNASTVDVHTLPPTATSAVYHRAWVMSKCNI